MADIPIGCTHAMNQTHIPRIITLTTDFGEGSPYVAEMKGVILSINPDVTLVDISHSVPPQDVTRGALVLEQATSAFPTDTVHIAVIDPGVGSSRRILLARTDQHFIIAPDNGLIDLVVRPVPSPLLIALENPSFWREEVSRTFHGRDVMAPVAAHLSRGVPMEQFGPQVSDYIRLDWARPTVEGRSLCGVVLAVDSFGNLITNVSVQILRTIPETADPKISLRDDITARWVSTYSEAAPGDCVGLMGSSGRLEVAVVNGNAARRLNAAVGDVVVVRW